MNGANSFLPDSVEWLTILAVSVGICLLAILILALLRRYSHSIRHLVIATLMVAHLFLLPCFLFLPKLQFEVIPQSWSAAVVDEVPVTPAIETSKRSKVVGENLLADRAEQVPESVGADGLDFQIATFPSNQRASQARTESPTATLSSEMPAPMSTTAKPNGRTVKSTIFWGWLIGFLLIVSWFALAWLWAIRKVAGLDELKSVQTSTLVSSLCKQIGVRRAPKLKMWRDDRIPMMLGIFRPVIVLPESFSTWPVSRQRHVLMHELTHVARLDSVHDSIAWLASACFWFNPLVWVLKKHQATERELACDQYVVSLSSNAEDYAADLLSVVKEASGFAPSTSIAMARNSELGQRIKSILRFDPTVLNRRKTLPRMLCGFLVVSAVLGSTLAFSQVAMQEDAESENEVTLFSLEDFAAELNDDQRKSLRLIQERQRSYMGPKVTTKISASGRVVNSKGEPVIGADVYLRDSVTHRRFETVGQGSQFTHAFFNKPRSFLIAKTKSNQKGEFIFADVESPKHYEEIHHFTQRRSWAVFAEAPGEAGSFNWHWLDSTIADEHCEIFLPESETLTGVVTDSSGNAVPGASVVVDGLSKSIPLEEDQKAPTRAQRELAARNFLKLGNSVVSPRATTDENGRFRIKGLPSSYRARLRVSHPDMILASTDLLQIAGSKSKPFSVVLDVGWKLQFSAKDPDGNPIPNAAFSLSGDYSNSIPWEARPSLQFRTDEKGEYLSPPLAACDLTILAALNLTSKGEPWKTPSWISSRIKVSKGQPDTIVSAEMSFEEGRLIYGQIVPLDKSTPITKEEFEELSVSFMVISDDMFSNLESYSAKPDAEGRFAIRVKDGVDGQISVAKSHKAFGFDLPGSVENFLFTSRLSQIRKEKVRLEKRLSKLPRSMIVGRDDSDLLESMPSRKMVKSNDTVVSTSPILLPVARSKTIKGVLVDESGNPVAGAQLKMLNRRQVNYGAGLQVAFPPDPTTNENGEFEITGVQERFLPSLRAIHPTDEELTADFGWSSVEEACSQELKLELKRGPSMKVIVTVNEMPVEGQDVSLSTSFGNSSNAPRASRKLTTDANGVCVFKNLARSERNFLNVEHSQKDRYTKSISTMGEQMEFTISDVNFISEGTGIVSGVVVDPSGKPVANVKVSAREYHEDRRSNSKFFESVETDATGRFKLTKIPEQVSVKLEFTPERPKEARYPRSPMPSLKLAKSGDTDLRVIVDPRLSQELPWRSKQKESGK